MIDRRLAAAAMWIAISMGAAYLFVFDPGRTGFFPPCPFRLLTGWQCPGCGTTRALHQLVHGHFLAAFELNPLTFILLPVAAFLILAFTRSAFSGTAMPSLKIPDRYVWLMTAVIICFWVIRNTSFYPFSS
jgi:hypothetical protein